jgi:hypothetical protein
MTTEPTKRKPWYRRLRLRISIRALIVFVLLASLVLGWWDYSAHEQRRAVLEIEAAGGKVNYEWAIVGGYLSGGSDRPKWDWLAENLGLDRVGNVTSVSFVRHRSDTKKAIDDPLMAEVAKLTRLKTFHLYDRNEITSAGVASLGHLKHLTDLDLSLNKDKRFDLSPLANLKSLEHLQLLHFAIVDEDLAHLSGLTKLKSLTIFPMKTDGPCVTDDGLVHLSGLTQLRGLQLDWTHIKGSGLAHLSRMTQLESLKIEYTRVDTLDSIPPLPRLTSLAMNQTPITDQGLASITRLPNLKFLNLQGTPVGDEGLAHLSKLGSLKGLDVGRSKVTDAGLARLAGHPGLESLCLWSTKVSDIGVDSLVTCPKLSSLNLWDTKLTDAGLAKLAVLPTMKILDVARTQVTRQGQSIAARPGLRITP